MRTINAFPQNERRLERNRRVGVTPTTFFEVLRIREFTLLLIKKWYFWIFTALAFAVVIAQSALMPAPYSATGTIRINSSMPSTEFYSERYSVETEIDLVRSYDLIGKTLDKLGHNTIIYPVRTKVSQLASIEPTGLVRKYTDVPVIPLIDQMHVVKSKVNSDLTRGHPYTVRYIGEHIEVLGESGELVTRQRPGETLMLDRGEVLLATLDYQPNWDYRLVLFDRHNLIRYIQQQLEIRPEPLKQGGGLIHVQLTLNDRLFVDLFLNALLDEYVLHGETRVKGAILQSISALEAKKVKLNEEIHKYTAAIETIQQDHNVVDPKFDANKLTEQIIATQKKVDDLQANRTKLLRDVTAQHPTISTINEKISVERNMLNALNQQNGALPNVARIIRTNLLQLDAAENNLTVLNGKLVQLKSYLAISKNYVDKIHNATPRHKPYRSKIFRLFILSGIFGAILGMFLIIVKGSNKVSKVKSAADIALNTRLPVFCRLSRSGNSSAMPRDAAGRTSTWRNIAQNIPYLFVGGTQKPIVTQPTSMNPVNYSFVDNLVKSHAATTDCLVIDFDFQRRLYSQYLGQENKPGVLEVLAGVKSIDEVTHTIQENYHVLPAGDGLATHSVEEISELAHAVVQEASLKYDQIFVVMPAEPRAAVVGPTLGYVLITASTGLTTQQFKQIFKDYDKDDRATAIVVVDK